MKTIGLIGGMSWESTTLYYQLINREVAKRMGGLRSAKLNLVSLDFADIAQRQREGDWDGMRLSFERLLANHPRDLLALQVSHLLSQAAPPLPFREIPDPPVRRSIRVIDIPRKINNRAPVRHIYVMSS
jgi:hypothetical protein